MEDEKHVKEMQENILSFREKYNDVTDLGLKWDVIKMKIRSFTLQYSNKTARIERDKEKELQIKMNNLQEKLSISKNDRNLLNEYNAVKVQLDKILNKKIKGIILRSKARWYENGKKHQLLSQSRKTKFPKEKISKPKLSNSEETEDTKEILEEEKSFYKNLYTSKNFDPENSAFDILFNNNLLMPLNEQLSKKCEGMLFEKECHLALKDMDKGKSPGSDGLSSEFYKVFWDDINLDVVASINYSFKKTSNVNLPEKRYYYTRT